MASPDFTEHCNQFSAKPPPALPKAKAPASRLASLTRWHPQQGDIPTEVSSPASCHHQQVVVTSKLSSPASWHHHQGGITIKVASPARWHHQQGGMLSRVASPAKQHVLQGGITSRMNQQIYVSTYAKYSHLPLQPGICKYLRQVLPPFDLALQPDI